MNNEKLDYIAPQAEIEVLGQEDVLAISVVDGQIDLDEGSFEWGKWW